MINRSSPSNKLKPCFFKPSTGLLIQAKRIWERLSMDFIGPLQSVTANIYTLVVVDKYSRYPFAFLCKDITADTVIRHLFSLFSLLGAPSSIHTDREAQFESIKAKVFLNRNGVIKTPTTSCHPKEM
ncbi:uncharacterized protein LOC136081476 [Hydra vulgaris]|uniref:Uncharacterized protein LOC136081476 n=1 Tax=Hydra vulgaris TaxID=6087 RepID=A0ABM4C076_HYDVU